MSTTKLTGADSWYYVNLIYCDVTCERISSGRIEVDLDTKYADDMIILTVITFVMKSIIN